MNENVNQLIKLIGKGTSPNHVVAEAEAQLQSAGFQKLEWDQHWELRKGNTYYVVPFRTALIAFRVNTDFTGDDQTRIISAHVDSPGLRIKADSEYPYKSYRRLNAEVYGGAINHTWMDRPLGMSGIVIIKDHTAGRPLTCYLDCRRPLFIVPNLSIHMSREINKGSELNPQVDLIPLAGLATGHETEANTEQTEYKEAYFTQFLAREISRSWGQEVSKEDIISYDLGLYIVQEGVICGMEGELLAAPRLDNLSSVQAAIGAVTDGYSRRTDGLDVIALFDHEEIGSRSKNGGAGNLLPFTLERIGNSLDITREAYLRTIAGGFLLSADTAHAINPNHPEKYDPTSGIRLGDGVAIKCSSKQSYAGDAETWAILKILAENNAIPCRFTYIRSDIPGGSTLGPILSSALPMRSADIGVPLLAMHSAIETISCSDQEHLCKFLKAFFSEPSRL